MDAAFCIDTAIERLRWAAEAQAALGYWAEVVNRTATIEREAWTRLYRCIAACQPDTVIQEGMDFIVFYHRRHAAALHSLEEAALTLKHDQRLAGEWFAQASQRTVVDYDIRDYLLDY